MPDTEKSSLPKMEKFQSAKNVVGEVYKKFSDFKNIIDIKDKS